MAARHLLLLLLAATAAAAVAASRGPGPNGGYHPPGTCGSLEAFLRTGPKFDFVAERLHKLPRRDFTLLLPLTSVPTGSWLRPGLPRSIVNDLVRNLVLTRNYRSVSWDAYLWCVCSPAGSSRRWMLLPRMPAREGTYHYLRRGTPAVVMRIKCMRPSSTPP